MASPAAYTVVLKRPDGSLVHFSSGAHCWTLAAAAAEDAHRGSVAVQVIITVAGKCKRCGQFQQEELFRGICRDCRRS